MTTGGRSRGRDGRRRWWIALLALAILPPVVAVIAALVLLAAGQGGGDADRTAAPDRQEIEAVHAAVHGLGDLCRSRPPGDPEPRVTAQVDSVLAFAEKHPDGRFPIDDETADSVSLLLVARQTLSDCSPSQAVRVDAALPPELRELSERR